MFRRNESSTKNRYLVAFVWLCICTFLFSFISPTIQYFSHTVARILTGTQKILYAKNIREAKTTCTAGSFAQVGIPYDSSWNQRSVLIFDKNTVPDISEKTYAYNQTEDAVIGKVEKNGAVVSLIPFFSSAAVMQAYVNEDPITISGKGNGTYTAEVPKQVAVVLGEPITIEISGHLKKIGTVVAVHDAPQSPMKTVTVRSLVAPSALQSVCVVSL